MTIIPLSPIFSCPLGYPGSALIPLSVVPRGYPGSIPLSCSATLGVIPLSSVRPPKCIYYLARSFLWVANLRRHSSHTLYLLQYYIFSCKVFPILVLLDNQLPLTITEFLFCFGAHKTPFMDLDKELLSGQLLPVCPVTHKKTFNKSSPVDMPGNEVFDHPLILSLEQAFGKFIPPSPTAIMRWHCPTCCVIEVWSSFSISCRLCLLQDLVHE